MKINKEEYLNHINGEKELMAMRRLLDLIEVTINRHSINYTDFLEPHMIKFGESILNRFEEISYSIEGGFSNSERKVIIIYSWYHFYENKTDSPLNGLEIKGNIENLDHRDVLGSILGLGIVRDKIGDIGFFKDSIKVSLLKDISSFVLYNLKKIKKENVEVALIDPDDLGEIVQEGTEKFIIISSMRLDSLISEAYNISRKDAQKLIESNLVKLNYAFETKTHKSIEEGDLVSVRGKGRFQIKKVEGLTKKERIKLILFFFE